MSAHSLRFVHASDLHLETALGGLRAIPDHLRDLLMHLRKAFGRLRQRRGRNEDSHRRGGGEEKTIHTCIPQVAWRLR